MHVVMQTSWAGLHFSFAPGDLVVMPDDLASARIALGHVRPAEAADLQSMEPLLFPGMPTPDATPKPAPPMRSTKEKRNARPRQ